MKAKRKMNLPVVYQAKSGAIELRGDTAHETVWATQAQVAEAFGVDIRTVNEHLANVYKTKELGRAATIRKFRIVQREGKRTVEREVLHYNLDAILSVGYRVNSKTATKFRQWATKTLRGYITQGYVIDRTRVAKNYARFAEAVQTVERLLPASAALNPADAMELVVLFADTWLSLDSYDRSIFPKGKLTKKRVALTAESLKEALARLRTELIKGGTATELFGTERTPEALVGIVGNVMQTYGGKELYPSVEEKAAHLLYFVVKNHPFADGNKRSGAYAFVWLLRAARVLDPKRLTAPALTALTLLVAESNPAHKERLIELIVGLLKR